MFWTDLYLTEFTELGEADMVSTSFDSHVTNLAHSSASADLSVQLEAVSVIAERITLGTDPSTTSCKIITKLPRVRARYEYQVQGTSTYSLLNTVHLCFEPEP